MEVDFVAFKGWTLLAVAITSNPWKPKKQVAAPLTTPLNPNGRNPPDPAAARYSSAISSSWMFQLWVSTVENNQSIHQIVNGNLWDECWHGFIEIFMNFFSNTFKAAADDDVTDDAHVTNGEEVVETRRFPNAER